MQKLVLAHDFFWPGLEKMMLPLTVTSSVKAWHDHYDRKIINYYRVCERICITTDQLNLPRFYAYETMRELLKKDKGFYSYKYQLKMLIQVIQSSMDPRVTNRIPAIENLLKL